MVRLYGIEPRNVKRSIHFSTPFFLETSVYGEDKQIIYISNNIFPSKRAQGTANRPSASIPSPIGTARNEVICQQLYLRNRHRHKSVPRS